MKNQIREQEEAEALSLNQFLEEQNDERLRQIRAAPQVDERQELLTYQEGVEKSIEHQNLVDYSTDQDLANAIHMYYSHTNLTCFNIFFC